MEHLYGGVDGHEDVWGKDSIQPRQIPKEPRNSETKTGMSHINKKFRLRGL